MEGFDVSNLFASESTVYKVVDSELGSALASGDYYVHYRPGEFVKAPEGTKFFVFESLEYAEDFVQNHIRLQIWRATAKGLDVAPRRIGDPTHSVDISDFWQTNRRGRSFGILAGHRTPRGTLWADELRLDECIVSHDLVPLPREPMFHSRLLT
jgi:hypothetical protein